MIPRGEVHFITTATRWCWLALTAIALSRAVAYSPLTPSRVQEPPPRAVRLITEIVPLDVWAWGWAIAFLVAVYGIAAPRIWKLLPLVIMCGAWSVAYAGSWLLYLTGQPLGSASAWLTSIIYGGLAAVMVAGGRVAGRALLLARAADGEEVR